MKDSVNCAAMIAVTDFDTVRAYLARSKSPGVGVLFVASRDLLADVAKVLDGSVEHDPEVRERKLNWLFAARHIVSGGDERTERCGLALNMDRVPGDSPVHVIFVPPFYLVHALEFPWNACPNPSVLSAGTTRG